MQQSRGRSSRRRGGHAGRAAPSLEDATYAAAITAPLTPGAGDRGVEEFTAFVASLPRHTHVTLVVPGAGAPELHCLPGALMPPLVAEVARVIRAKLRGSAGLARRQGLPPALGVVQAVVRHYAQLPQQDCDTAPPVQPAQVYGFTLRPDRCVRIPPHMNRVCQCTDPFTGQTLPPEEGLEYL